MYLLQFLKITSVFCNSSKLLTAYLNCSLVNMSRTHSYVAAEFVTKKPVFNLKMDVNVLIRRSSRDKFKQIITWPNIDLCKFAENINETYSVIKEHLLFINKKLNGIIHRCPYKQVEINNFSLSLQGNEDLNTYFCPNGEIKFNVMFYNNREKNILLFEGVVLQHLVKIKD